MAKRPPTPVQLITLTLDDIVIPEVVTPAAKTSDRFRDVIPEAMVHFIRQAKRFPCSPDVAYEGGRFVLLNAFETARAAGIAGFTGSLVCFVRRGAEQLPAPLHARLQTLKQVIALDAAEGPISWHVLCFGRPLSNAERVLVEDLFEVAARAASPGGPPSASMSLDRAWPTPDVFAWRARFPTQDDRSGLLEFMTAFRTMHNAGIPLVALNGRTPLAFG